MTFLCAVEQGEDLWINFLVHADVFCEHVVMGRFACFVFSLQS